MTHHPVQRLILHVDMDAFFASVEQRDNPELEGKPVIVGGTKNRGVVSTASYEARSFGVHSALPMSQAMRLCPQAIVLPVRMSRYQQVSKAIMKVLSGFSPSMEQLSVDEAFLDMTGSENLFGPPMSMAKAIMKKIFDATELTCSIGIACNKFLAKLASDLKKPNGITLVPFGHEREFIAPLPVKKLWGVGPKSTEKLKNLDLYTIGDVARADPDWLERHMGSLGIHIHALAQGIDDREVSTRRNKKSIGHERTFDNDILGQEGILAMLRKACRQVAKDLRSKNLLAGAIRIKIRYSDNFQLVTRDTRLALPCQDSATLFICSKELLERIELSRPIRLAGIAAFELQQCDGPVQTDLFLSPGSEKNTKLERAVDAIKDKFGDKIKRGSEQERGG